MKLLNGLASFLAKFRLSFSTSENPNPKSIHVYISNFVSACQQKNIEAAQVNLKAAWAIATNDEAQLTQVCLAVYDVKNIFAFTNVLEKYCDTHPESASPVRALWAHMLVIEGQYQRGAEEARYYLALLKRGHLLETLHESKLRQIGFERAIAPATAAYTVLGWRSYALRIFNWALQPAFIYSKATRDFFETSKRQLEEELKQNNLREIDEKWECFYQSGQGSDELISLCQKHKFEEFAKRIELLECDFRFGNPAPVFDDEFFKAIFSAQDDAGNISNVLQ